MVQYLLVVHSFYKCIYEYFINDRIYISYTNSTFTQPAHYLLTRIITPRTCKWWSQTLNTLHYNHITPYDHYIPNEGSLINDLWIVWYSQMNFSYWWIIFSLGLWWNSDSFRYCLSSQSHIRNGSIFLQLQDH